MTALILLIDQIVSIYFWTLLAYIAIHFLRRIHEPLMRLVRRYLPDLGGIDLSPIVLLLAIQFLRNLLVGFLTDGL